MPELRFIGHEMAARLPRTPTKRVRVQVPEPDESEWIASVVDYCGAAKRAMVQSMDGPFVILMDPLTAASMKFLCSLAGPAWVYMSINKNGTIKMEVEGGFKIGKNIITEDETSQGK